jgi:hypothetical protein
LHAVASKHVCKREGEGERERGWLAGWMDGWLAGVGCYIGKVGNRRSRQPCREEEKKKKTERERERERKREGERKRDGERER